MASQQLPSWDLSDLYKSPTDKNLLLDMQRASSRAVKFKRKYSGKLSTVAKSPSRLLAAIEEYESIIQQAAKPIEYAHLRFSECATDPERGALLQNSRERYLTVNRELTFFDLELLSVPAATLRRAQKSSQLVRFRNFIKKLLDSKPHRLSESEEQILQEKRMTGADAFVRLFDEEFAAKRFLVGRGAAAKTMSEAEVLDLLRHPQRTVRKAAAEGFTRGLEDEARRITFIFNTIVQDKAVEDRFTKFEAPESSRHLSNQISKASVDSMVSAVVRRADSVASYYRLKAKLLGVKALNDYDRYAPLPTKSKERVSFADARRIITDASAQFSDEYASIVDEFFDRKWIHAAPHPGKRSGAFCTFATADTHPYILVNYTGTLREVMTLAHELGHGVHAYLMRKQGYLNFGTPLTIAETASVFGEMLVFNHLKASINNERELLGLYCAKIEEMFATVFRQIVMHRFEQSVHKARRVRGELRTEDINEIWMFHQKEMFQESIQLTEGYRLWWSYISHFFHSPFYVYAYGFGELLTVALFAQYQAAEAKGRKGEFVRRYLNMLSLGDAAAPADLVQPFGISLEDRNFWSQGVKIIEKMLKDIQKLA